MHSPWGMIEQITEKKGWSFEYVLEQITWSNLLMMSSDRIRMVKRSEMIVKVDKKDLKKQREQHNGGS